MSFLSAEKHCHLHDFDPQWEQDNGCRNRERVVRKRETEASCHCCIQLAFFKCPYTPLLMVL
jgi:hypothetical protein